MKPRRVETLPAPSRLGTENPAGLFQSLIDSIQEVVPSATPEIPGGWPKKLWLIEFPQGNYGCLRLPPTEIKGASTEGLAAFKYKANAVRYLHLLKASAMSGHKFVKVEFQEAVDIVISKVPRITALMLADDPTKPLIYQVK